MSTNFDKYMAGEPLNEELRALKEGRLPDIGPFLVTGPAATETELPGKPKRALTRDERLALKDLRHSQAWPVLQFLLKRATLSHIESATLLSQDDPLGKSDEVTQLWAYVKIFKRAHAEFNLLVGAEISELEGMEEPDETKSTVEGPQARRSTRQGRSSRAGKD